jgi:hypothetical protein
MHVVVASLALAALLLAGLGTAGAEDRSGQLITRSFAALPTPMVVSVEPDDNTRTNMTLATRLSRELAQRGYQVAPGHAPLALRFDSEIRSNVSTAGAQYHREATGAPDSDMAIGAAGPPDRPVGIANMLSSSPGRGVIGERSGGDYSRPLRYVINARIEDRHSGSLIWQGHVSYDSERTDADPLLEAMVPLLVTEIGQTVRDRRFSLD